MKSRKQKQADIPAPLRKRSVERYPRWARALTLAALLCLTSTLSATNVVCREPGGIYGYEEAGKRAERFLPDTFGDNTSTVYVTGIGGSYYFHSNYRTPGFGVATKIATDHFIDLVTAAKNIMYASEEQVPPYFGPHSLSQFNFILDRSLFTGGAASELLRSSPPEAKLFVTVGDAKTRPLRELQLSGVPTWLEEITSNLLLRPAAGESGDVASALPFTQRDIRVAALVENQATHEAMKELLPEGNRLLASADTNLDAIFRNQNDRLVLIIGHIEEGVIVRRDHTGAELRRYSFDDLRSAAAKSGANLFILGCHSANFLDTGVASSFNTVDAVQRIAAALSSSTALGFWSGLASPDMPLVIQREMVEGMADGSTRSQIEGVIVRTPEGTEAASVFATYTTAPPPSIGGGGGGGGGGGIISCWSVFFIVVLSQLGLTFLIGLIRRPWRNQEN